MELAVYVRYVDGGGHSYLVYNIWRLCDSLFALRLTKTGNKWNWCMLRSINEIAMQPIGGQLMMKMKTAIILLVNLKTIKSA